MARKTETNKLRRLTRGDRRTAALFASVGLRRAYLRACQHGGERQMHMGLVPKPAGYVGI